MENTVQSDYIPIDSCDMNLTNASNSVKSIIGASNRAHLGISIFRSDNKILARCYENLDVCGECPLMLGLLFPLFTSFPLLKITNGMTWLTTKIAPFLLPIMESRGIISFGSKVILFLSLMAIELGQGDKSLINTMKNILVCPRLRFL